MENSAQQSQVPELSHAMVGFLGIVCRNNLATYFVHSFLACEKRDKKLEVSYKHFSGPAEKAVPARHGCPSVTQHPPGPGVLTQPLGKNSPCRETLWASDCGSPHGTASSRYICSLTGKQHNLIYHLTRTVSYAFSTRPLSTCSSTNLCVIFSTESCRLFYWKKSFQKFLLKHRFEDNLRTTQMPHWGFFSAAAVFLLAFKSSWTFSQLNL